MNGHQEHSERLEIKVDENFINRAASILNDLWDDVCLNSVHYSTCPIKDCIDFVLVDTATKTWPYILMTQLLGKAADEHVNILVMHKSSKFDGAWDARSLCEHVISREGCFEPTVLEGILGSVKQPYNNSPGQKPELSKENKTSAAHVPIRNAVIEGLSQVKSSDEALSCLGYFLFVCKRRIEELVKMESLVGPPILGHIGCASLRSFLCNLARRGRDGEGLGVSVALLLSLTLREENGYIVNLYQSNTSRRKGGYQADLEVYCGSELFAALELKDKPFSASEVLSSADQAWSNGFSRFLFVYGYGAGSVNYETFSQADYKAQESRGVFGSCVGFEQMVDAFLLILEDINLEKVRSLTVGILSDARVKARTQTVARELLRELLADARK